MPLPSNLPPVLSPVITPFNSVGEPDSSRLIKQCHWLKKCGVGLAIFGTNSEANSMSKDQKLRLLDDLIDSGLNPDYLMPGTGACSIDETSELSQAAIKAGCAGVLVLPPFYYKDVSDEGLFAFFSQVIDRVADERLHIYLYNIPPVTKIPLSLSLLVRLKTKYPTSVMGMKDSSGDWSYTHSVIEELAPSGFQVYAGSETFLLQTLRAGGAGCISATANINPGAIAKLAQTWQNSDADDQQNALDQVRATFAKFPMIPAMKAAVAHFGHDPEWERVLPPLEELTNVQKKNLLTALQDINFSIQGL
jgi:4-hydroxy-tetrahydrodipicolinate synthase